MNERKNTLSNTKSTECKIRQAKHLQQLLDYSSQQPGSWITITVKTDDGQVATGTFEDIAQLVSDLYSTLTNLVEELS